MNPAAENRALLSFEEARQTVEAHAAELRPVGMEEVPLESALGRVLAEEIAADRDFPPFPRATRDGYAVRTSDAAAPPARLRVVAQITAGASALPQIQAGEAAEIMTGAPVPPGADAVVMVEHTSREQEHVLLAKTVSAGENVVPAGAEGRAGQVVLPRGTRLSHAQIALAAAVGATELHVFRRPRVAILATGDELVTLEAVPGPHQIRNSNTYSLAAQVEAAGGRPVRLPIAHDREESLHQWIEVGLESDLLLLSGGVSMGKYDLVEGALAAYDARFFFTGVRIQPGKPAVFGDAHIEEGERKPFFGLPGNPISTMVTFRIFVLPVLDALSGALPAKLIFPKAMLKKEIRTRTGLTRFLPAALSGQGERAEVELVPWQGSGDLVAVADSNCYIVVPPERERIPAGEMVSVLLS